MKQTSTVNGSIDKSRQVAIANRNEAPEYRTCANPKCNNKFEVEIESKIYCKRNCKPSRASVKKERDRL